MLTTVALVRANLSYHTYQVMRFAKTQPVLFGGVILALFVMLVFLTVFHYVFSSIFTVYGAFLLYFVSAWMFVRTVAYAIIFVGSNYLWRRKVENNFRNDMAKQWHQQLRQLQYVFEAFNGEDSMDEKWNMQGAAQGVRTLEYMTRNFRGQQMEGIELTPEQIALREAAQKALKTLKLLKVVENKDPKNTMMFPRWIAQFENAPIIVPGRRFLRQHGHKFQIIDSITPELKKQDTGTVYNLPGSQLIIPELINICKLLYDLYKTKNQKTLMKAQEFLWEHPVLGSLDQLRTELAYSRNGMQIWIPVDSKTFYQKLSLRVADFLGKWSRRMTRRWVGAAAMSGSKFTYGELIPEQLNEDTLFVDAMFIPSPSESSKYLDDEIEDEMARSTTKLFPAHNFEKEIMSMPEKIGKEVEMAEVTKDDHEEGATIRIGAEDHGSDEQINNKESAKNKNINHAATTSEDHHDEHDSSLHKNSKTSSSSSNSSVFSKRSFYDSAHIAKLNFENLERPVVLYCSQNAVFYETQVFGGQWIDFYTETLGCNLLLWNYRGYGRSDGTCTVDTLLKDAESVANFLKNKGVKRLAVHGVSVGGIPASFIAKQFPSIEFVVLDRTFSDLYSIAEYGYGNWAKNALIFANIHCNVLENYMAIPKNTTKVLLVEPNDEIIPDMASLRTAVANQITSQVENKSKYKIFEYEELKKIISSLVFLQKVLDIVFLELDEFCDKYRKSILLQSNSRSSSSLSNMISGANNTSSSSVRRMNSQSQSRHNSGNFDNHGVEMQQLSNSSSSINVLDSLKNAEDEINWLETHAIMVRNALIETQTMTVVRTAFEYLLEEFNIGGSSLESLLSYERSVEDTALDLQKMLSNLVIWGSLPTDEYARSRMMSNYGGTTGSCDDEPNEKTVLDWLYPHLISGGFQRMWNSFAEKKGTPKQTPSDSAIRDYHKVLSYKLAVSVRNRLKQMTMNMGHSTDEIQDSTAEEPQEEQLLQGQTVLNAAIASHLQTIDNFLVGIARFFKTHNLQYLPSQKRSSNYTNKGSDLESGNNETDTQIFVQPIPHDTKVSGHIVHLNCGHNGSLTDREMDHVFIYLQHFAVKSKLSHSSSFAMPSSSTSAASGGQQIITQ